MPLDGPLDTLSTEWLDGPWYICFLCRFYHILYMSLLRRRVIFSSAHAGDRKNKQKPQQVQLSPLIFRKVCQRLCDAVCCLQEPTAPFIRTGNFIWLPLMNRLTCVR